MRSKSKYRWAKTFSGHLLHHVWLHFNAVSYFNKSKRNWLISVKPRLDVCPSSSVVKMQGFWSWRNVNQLSCEREEEQFFKQLEGNSKSVKNTAVSSIKSLEHCCFTVGRRSRTALRGTVCVAMCVRMSAGDLSIKL